MHTIAIIANSKTNFALRMRYGSFLWKATYNIRKPMNNPIKVPVNNNA